MGSDDNDGVVVGFGVIVGCDDSVGLPLGANVKVGFALGKSVGSVDPLGALDGVLEGSPSSVR